MKKKVKNSDAKLLRLDSSPLSFLMDKYTDGQTNNKLK